MDGEMNIKSILLNNLPNDPHTQTKIIIDTFGRFYRIPESTLHDSDVLQSDESTALATGKRRLTQMKETVNKHYDPFLNAKKLCEEFIRLDMKELGRFLEKWDKSKLKKLFGEMPLQCFDPKSFIEDLASLNVKGNRCKQEWNKLKEKCKMAKSPLDDICAPAVELNKTVQDMIKLKVEDLDMFNQKLHLFMEKVTQLKMDDANFLNLVKRVNDANIDRQEKHKMWVQYSAAFLCHLADDIVLVQRTKADDWNPTILNEIIGLINSIWRIFSNLDIDKWDLPIDVKEKFIGAKFRVRKEYLSLDKYQTRAEEGKKTNGHNTPGARTNDCGKVSAKSVRELFILNEVSQKVLNGRLRLVGQRNITKVKLEIGEVVTLTNDPSRLTYLIEAVLENIHRQHQDKANTIFRMGKLIRSEEDRRELAWVPTMIVVVLDPHTGFLLTVSTQPACKSHFILKQAANKIPYLQVGCDFERGIAQCYDNWKKERCAEMRGRWSQELKKLKESKDSKEGPSKEMDTWSTNELKELYPEQKPEVYNQLPGSTENSKIVCWAISGHTFKAQSPCPRCAYFYSSWDLKTTKDFLNREYLFNYLNSGMADAKEIHEFHCAETVAAAKIYAWRHETLGFS